MMAPTILSLRLTRRIHCRDRTIRRSRKDIQQGSIDEMSLMLGEMIQSMRKGDSGRSPNGSRASAEGARLSLTPMDGVHDATVPLRSECQWGMNQERVMHRLYRPFKKKKKKKKEYHAEFIL